MQFIEFFRVFFGPVFAILATLAVYEWIDNIINKWRERKWKNTIAILLPAGADTLQRSGDCGPCMARGLSLAAAAQSLIPGILIIISYTIETKVTGPIWAGYFFALVRSRRGFFVHRPITSYCTPGALYPVLRTLIRLHERNPHAPRWRILRPCEKRRNPLFC